MTEPCCPICHSFLGHWPMCPLADEDTEEQEEIEAENADRECDRRRNEDE